MNGYLSYLAILDLILTNWSNILIKSSVDGAPLIELLLIENELFDVDSEEKAEEVLDKLHKILVGTPAYSYAKKIEDRCSTNVQKDLTNSPAFQAKNFGDQLNPEKTYPLNKKIRHPSSSDSIKKHTEAVSEIDYCSRLIHFATNRKPCDASDNPFSDEPNNNLIFGRAKITIPIKRHKIGKLEKHKFWEILYDNNDPRRYILINELETQNSSYFIEQISQNNSHSNNLLIITHGYNVTFEEAAMHAAQFSFDINFRGHVVLFSWPSLGRMLGYFHDCERAQLSVNNYYDLLKITENIPNSTVHTIAHSMGSRIMLHGLSKNDWPNNNIEQVIFIAADVYTDIFKQLFPKINRNAKRFTSYVSRFDIPLYISSILHKAQRVGIKHSEKPFIIDGLDTIDASTVNNDFLHHNYFSKERPVLTDINILLNNDLSPASRGLRSNKTKPYWFFPK